MNTEVKTKSVEYDYQRDGWCWKYQGEKSKTVWPYRWQAQQALIQHIKDSIGGGPK